VESLGGEGTQEHKEKKQTWRREREKTNKQTELKRGQLGMSRDVMI
jgi:hypothetical protein